MNIRILIRLDKRLPSLPPQSLDDARHLPLEERLQGLDNLPLGLLRQPSVYLAGHLLANLPADEPTLGLDGGGRRLQQDGHCVPFVRLGYSH